MKQIWHPNNGKLTINSDRKKPVSFNSYNSDYYGSYTEEQSLYFEFKNQLETKITFKA